MSVHPPPQTGASLVAALAAVVATVDRADVDVRYLSATPFRVAVQLLDEDAVDAVCVMLDDPEADSGASTNYSRAATVAGVTVNVFSPRTKARCEFCGRHQGGEPS